MPMFHAFLKTLIGKEVTVELKNDLILNGTLESVDLHFNLKLGDVTIENEDKYPQLSSSSCCVIRGSTMRYIHLPEDEVDTELLEEATKIEAAKNPRR